MLLEAEHYFSLIICFEEICHFSIFITFLEYDICKCGFFLFLFFLKDFEEENSVEIINVGHCFSATPKRPSSRNVFYV